MRNHGGHAEDEGGVLLATDGRDEQPVRHAAEALQQRQHRHPEDRASARDLEDVERQQDHQARLDGDDDDLRSEVRQHELVRVHACQKKAKRIKKERKTKESISTKQQ